MPGSWSIHTEVPHITVSLSVNSVKDKDKEVSVTILTTASFDAFNVNPSSVRFGQAGTEAAPVSVKLQDKNGDGRNDLALLFNFADTTMQCGSTSAQLTGLTKNGQLIVGSSPIAVKGCK